jgi:hypothetical protein
VASQREVIGPREHQTFSAYRRIGANRYRFYATPRGDGTTSVQVDRADGWKKWTRVHAVIVRSKTRKED